jgi:peptide/nickel transport system permease protein
VQAEATTVKPTERQSHNDRVTDGGQSVSSSDEISFDLTSAETEPLSKRERYEQIFKNWVYAPLAIIWNDWRAKIGGLILLIYVAMGTVGVMLVEKPTGDGARLLQPFENWAFPLGTDFSGRDLFGQIIHATPAMLEMILAGAVFTTLVATLIGTFTGYKGGYVDRVLIAITDILMTLPGLPLVIVLAVILEPSSPWAIGILLSVNAWAGLARTIRSQVLTIREENYVEASRLMGTPTSAIIAKNILPGIMPYIAINFVNSGRRIIFSSVALYFLGILPFTSLNWGVMLNAAYYGGAVFTPSMFHWLLVPTITIVALSLAMTLFAQGMDRLFNPRVIARHTTPSDEVDTADESEEQITVQTP